MIFLFNQMVDFNFKFFQYEIPEAFSQNINIGVSKPCVISFGRFIDFDEKVHGEAINFMFTNMDKLCRNIIGEDNDNYKVTYKFVNREHLIKNLSVDQMLFLCGILHNIDAKNILVALIDILIINYNINFDNIKQFAKDDKFTMKIYVPS